MNIESLFSPKSIAVIGASTRVGNVGNDIVKNLVTQGFAGGIYPVNPHAEELYDKKCFPGILDIPDEVELAVVVVPAVAVPDVVRGAIEKGVRAIIVISSGFREVGNEKAEEEIRVMCDDAGVALLGPNCLGVLCPKSAMNASFAVRLPRKGSIAFLSQSGALCAGILDYTEKTNLGFSKFVSMGNKAQLDEVVLMRFLEEDPDTKIVVLYVEQLSDAPGFIHAVRALRKKGKSVLVVKSGSTSAGAGASASHTGALAGNDTVYDALFEKAGAIRVKDFDDLFEYLSGFGSTKFPKGDRVAVLTNAGGPGVLATDEIILQGLALAEISEETKNALKEFLPASSSTHNPIDILGDADALRYQKALETILQDANVDAVEVVLTPQSMTQISETAQAIADLARTSEKTILVSFMGAMDVLPGIEILETAGIPVSRFPQKSVRTLAMMRRFVDEGNRQEEMFDSFDSERVPAQEILAKYPNGGSMSVGDALAFFSAYGFSVTKSRVIQSPDTARSAVEYVGGLSAFKILSPDIEHKSDAGGVALHITPERAEEEYTAMMARVEKNVPHARIDGILVAEMVTERGAEFILGMIKDPNLGHAVMVGFGGVYVEVFRDVAFGLVPVSRSSAKIMIDKLKSKALLRGARGGELLDEEQLLLSIGKMSKILEEHPEILEADMNPLVVFAKGKGIKVLDARITLA